MNKYQNKEIKLHWFQVDDFSDLAKPVVDHSTKFSATPLSIETGIMELVKERLVKTKQKLICIRCGKWERTFEVKMFQKILFVLLVNLDLLLLPFGMILIYEKL